MSWEGLRSLKEFNVLEKNSKSSRNTACLLSPGRLLTPRKNPTKGLSLRALGQSPSQLAQMLLTVAPPGPTRPSSSCSLMHSW